MTNLQLAHKVRKLIGENKIEKAFTLLNKQLGNHPLLDNIILLSSEWRDIKNKEKLGIEASETINIKKNANRHKILTVVGQLYQEEKQRIKIYISYDRTRGGEALAKIFKEKFQEDGFFSFLDKLDITIGSDWATSIDKSINESDFFVLLLSPKANNNETVYKEIGIAYQRYIQTGDLTILPILVQFPTEQVLSGNLRGKLQGLVPGEWNNHNDTSRIIGNLLAIFSGKEVPILPPLPPIPQQLNEPIKKSVQPTPKMQLELPKGSVWLDSSFYIQRKEDEELMTVLEEKGGFIRIRGPKQFGKTSLLYRMLDRAEQLDYHIVSIDFQEIPQKTLSDLDQLLYTFCQYFVEEFKLKESFPAYWNENEDKKQATSKFIKEEILKVQEQPILLAVDEADHLFSNKDVSMDFFLLLRSWHERCKNPMKRIWQKFRVILSYSTEAKLAIQDLSASPLNVGQERTMQPFTKNQVENLAIQHQLSWNDDQLRAIMDLLGGQPYLVRKAMYVLAKKEIDFEVLIAESAELDGPFGDHLRHHLFMVLNVKKATKILTKIVRAKPPGQTAEVEEIKKDYSTLEADFDPIMTAILESVGLIKGTYPEFRMTNTLYKNCFKKYLKNGYQ